MHHLPPPSSASPSHAPHSSPALHPAAGCYSSQSLEAAAYALQDTLTVALYRITAAFGDGLLKVR